MRWRQRFSTGMAFPLLPVCVAVIRSPDESVDVHETIAELVNDRSHRGGGKSASPGTPADRRDRDLWCCLAGPLPDSR